MANINGRSVWRKLLFSGPVQPRPTTERFEKTIVASRICVWNDHESTRSLLDGVCVSANQMPADAYSRPPGTRQIVLWFPRGIGPRLVDGAL